MPPTNVVVDGSNIATEGRSTPSLEQLDQAVSQYLSENPDSKVTVVVDASFGHRIDRSEREAFEEALAHGELVSPPAGAIGRGDAFLLRIAERTGARVLSNDSFREFHTEHPWLFDEDRLVGGTPVPGVGWIFSPRRPVRGPLTPDTRGKSRERKAPEEPKKEEKKPSRRRKKEQEPAEVQAAIAQATEEALGDEDAAKPSRAPKRKNSSAPEAVNDPFPFIRFVSDHPLGSRFEGTVVSFTSHGAMAQVEDMLCYVPLAGLADPPPRRARDVLKLGETRTFELVALDPVRRGAQLALPEMVGSMSQIAEGAEEAASEMRRGRRRGRKEPAGATEPEPATPSDGASPAAKASKGAKAAKPPKAVKAVKAVKAAKAAEATKTTKATKAKKAAKSANAAKPAKAAQSAKAAKVAKVTKATHPTKAAATTKSAKPSKSAGSSKQTGAAKKAPAKSVAKSSSTPRKVVKSS